MSIDERPPARGPQPQAKRVFVGQPPLPSNAPQQQEAAPTAEEQGFDPAQVLDKVDRTVEEAKKLADKSVPNTVAQQQPIQEQPQQQTRPSPMEQQPSDPLQVLLTKLSPIYEKVKLPSCGRFYPKEVGVPEGGEISIRKMTIQEEKILATPKLLRNGTALDRVFESCIKEDIDPAKLFIPDRIFLLIYLRAISYGPIYEVTLQCPTCNDTWTDDIDLQTLEVNYLDENDEISFVEKLPDSGFEIEWHLQTGEDSLAISRYQAKRVKGFGANVVDDSGIIRARLLIDRIENITSKADIETIISKLPARDSNFIEGLFDNPPFGLDTQLMINCPFCGTEFRTELPMDASFFSPRTKKPS